MILPGVLLSNPSRKTRLCVLMTASQVHLSGDSGRSHRRLSSFERSCSAVPSTPLFLCSGPNHLRSLQDFRFFLFSLEQRNQADHQTVSLCFSVTGPCLCWVLVALVSLYLVCNDFQPLSLEVNGGKEIQRGAAGQTREEKGGRVRRPEVRGWGDNTSVQKVRRLTFTPPIRGWRFEFWDFRTHWVGRSSETMQIVCLNRKASLWRRVLNETGAKQARRRPSVWKRPLALDQKKTNASFLSRVCDAFEKSLHHSCL